MARAKEFSLDLRKRIVNAYCKGEGYTKLSKRFQVSRTAVRGISSRNSKKAVLYKTCLEEEGRQKFRKLLSES